MGYSLSKIAKELGLSKATVSLILNGKAREMKISEELEQKVNDFCKKVNYVPNIHAQRINRKYVKNIGFLITHFEKNQNPFEDPNVSNFTGGIMLAAEKVDYRVSIQLFSPDMDESKVFNWLRNHEIDGLIYYGFDIPNDWRKIFYEEKRCVVGIGSEASENIASVRIDNFKASADLTEYLIKKGKRKFFYVAGTNCYVGNERLRGFFSVLDKYNINFPTENLIYANFEEEKAEKFISNNIPDVDAIICANDNMAIGAIKALKKHNINVPDQIAVAGADNIAIGQYFTPSITTFDNKPKELGYLAFNTLYKMIKGGKPEDVVIESKIIIRDSTK